MSEIRVDTISEKTSANGVSIDGVTIKDGGITATTGAIVFNEASADVDFRVESNGNASMLHVNSGNNLVGIGADPDLGAGLHIKTADTGASVDGNADELVIEGTRSGLSILSANNDFGYILFGDDGSNNIGSIRYGHSANDLRIIVGGSEAMVIDGTGAVTMPKQPAFSAVPSAQQSNITSGTDLLFGVELFDQNADYNTGNSTFTAPVTGRYHLGYSIRLQEVPNDAAYVLITLPTSNRVYYYIYDTGVFDEQGAYIEFNGDYFADMDANDTAKVSYTQSGGTTSTDFSTASFFYGYLVC